MRRGLIAGLAGAALVGVSAAAALAGAGTPARNGAPAHTRVLSAARTAAPPSGRPTATPIPVLMYHVVNDPPAGAPFPGLYVSGATFAGQVEWLAGHGYHAVTLQQAYDHWRYGRRLPARPIVISFDDGYQSQYANAAPVLRRRHWPGVLNLKVGNTNTPGGLSTPEVRLMIAAGWELAAHTLTHPDLTRVDDARLQQEVAGSRAVLRRTYHVPVNFFCYPSGRYNDHVVAAVRSAGFLGATTTAFGLARPPDLFRLDRIRVDRSDGVAGLAAKLRSLGSGG